MQSRVGHELFTEEDEAIVEDGNGSPVGLASSVEAVQHKGIPVGRYEGSRQLIV